VNTSDDRLWAYSARFGANTSDARLRVYPALLGVNISDARFRVNSSDARLRVNTYDARLRVYPTLLGVNTSDARSWVYLARFRVNMSDARPRANTYDVRSQVYNAHSWEYPVCFRVNMYHACPQMKLDYTFKCVNPYHSPKWENLCADCLWVNLYAVFYVAHPQVIQYACCEWEKQSATPQWENNKLILPACFGMYDLLQFEESHISVWRDSTAQYSVADHPFFVFQSKLVDCSNFSETFKIYAHHLQQYQLVCIIEFILHWSNHWCHFISKHAFLLVNFDLAPQQHCRKAYLTMCRSQYHKHDFAIMSSFYDLQTNYAVVDFVKYFENIIQWTFQHKHIYKIPVRFNAKGKIQINNGFEFSEQVVSNKIGGGKHVEKIEMDVISPFVINTPQKVSDIEMCEFVDHLETSECLKKYQSSDHLLCNVPLHHFINYLFQPNRISIGNKHGLHIWKNMTKVNITNLFKNHDDVCKHEYLTVFRPYKQLSSSKRKSNYRKKLQRSLEVVEPEHNIFPPDVPDASLRKKIINDFCDAIDPSKFEEAGCAVCGALTLRTELFDLSSLNINVSVLNTTGLGFTRRERKDPAEPISELDGPTIDTSSDYICISCKDKVRHRKLPKFALARGLWLGEIPDELQQLSFAEKLLIGKVRHNRCVVRVAKGMHKMIANAVTFEHPMQKIYTVLPPPIEEMDEVLAFIFTGPCQPTEDDFHRIPLLVRRNKVAKALEWLKLNHQDYADLEISYKNLESYPEDSPPVVINYRHSVTNKIPEATSVHDMEFEHGTEEGVCPFTVHTLTSEEYDTMNSETLKAMAAKHLDDGGKVLAIGHSKEPQSIWKNPKLYPQMFPWLFPYGLGGIGHERQRHKLSDAEHKRHLLLYHDKRFQKDPYFPLIAFNHEQIKDSTTGGFILAKQKSFDNIANRLLGINSEVLADITERMMKGERIKGESKDEKDCLQLIHDLDHFGGHVKGSITSKKYMKNEIWSLISFRGAPSWYITLSPTDSKHPISLYYADTKERFTPVIHSKSERESLIADNPVASARFFHFMIQAFIKHVLGVDADHPGIYGDTSSYYGTVEQQGRLTLHLHLLLWIRGALTPQEIRDRIMDPESDFQKKMVEYLESVHMGEFITGSLEDVRQNLDIAELDGNYKNPTETLPIPPPPQCNQNECGKCESCNATSSWETQFQSIVDDILLRSNLHKCTGSAKQHEKKKMKHKQKNTVNKYQPVTGCLSNKWGKCKARFPRKTFEHTEVNMDSGALNIKKGESMLNNVTAEVTYLIRSNTDVTSLLSGTAIKAVVAYVSDYISKPALKTYLIFEAVKSVFDRNSEMLGGSLDRKEKARRLLTQIVNNLTSKMEIGGPMASMYLLKNPDHYTNHNFRTFYWPNFVRAARYVWNPDNKEHGEDQLVLLKIKGKIIGRTFVQDYVFRPVECNQMSLYDWIRLSEVEKCPSEIEQNNCDDNINGAGSDNGNDIDFNVKDNKDTFYPFLKDHPLYHSHHVMLLDDIQGWVPNFVGGALPRSDCGDREYYCSTMLTFFKLW
jgi:hypothetical protein